MRQFFNLTEVHICERLSESLHVKATFWPRIWHLDHYPGEAPRGP